MNTINSIVIRISAALLGNALFRVLLIAICADMIFGSLRAAKEHKWNSAIGIDGGIRKAGMLAAVILLQLCDMLIKCNAIALLPTEAQEALAKIRLLKLGIAELFSMLFILYELTSVLKNMMLCGLPIPKGLRQRLARFLQLMTDETNANLMQATEEAEPPDIPAQPPVSAVEDYSSIPDPTTFAD